MRDVLISVPPATTQSNWDVLAAGLSALVGIWLSTVLARINWAVIALEAASLSFFGLVGTGKALAYGMDPLPAIMIGTIEAAGDGAIRDVLLQVPVGVLYVGTFYAAAAYVAVDALGANMLTGILVCWFVTVAIRLATVKLGAQPARADGPALPRSGDALPRATGRGGDGRS